MNFALFLSICCVLITIKATVFLRRKMNVSRWNSAFRHIVALLGAWAGFSLISTLFLVINLFEAGKFSASELLKAFEIGMSLWIVGLLSVLVILFMTTRRLPGNIQSRQHGVK